MAKPRKRKLWIVGTLGAQKEVHTSRKSAEREFQRKSEFSWPGTIIMEEAVCVEVARHERKSNK